MPDVDDTGLEKSDHFIKKIKNEFVIVFIGRAAGIGIGIIGPFCQFGMAGEQVVAMGERGHLRDEFHPPFPAVVDQVLHLLLRQDFSPAVGGVDGVFLKVELVADLVGLAGVFIHERRIFQPAFIDLRVGLVLQGAAEFDHNGVDVVPGGNVDHMFPFIHKTGHRFRQIDFDPAAMGFCLHCCRADGQRTDFTQPEQRLQAEPETVLITGGNTDRSGGKIQFVCVLTDCLIQRESDLAGRAFRCSEFVQGILQQFQREPFQSTDG